MLKRMSRTLSFSFQLLVLTSFWEGYSLYGVGQMDPGSANLTHKVALSGLIQHSWKALIGPSRVMCPLLGSIIGRRRMEFYDWPGIGHMTRRRWALLMEVLWNR